MNNQITILDRNNQSITVDLICYFSTNNKKYLFYNKNEIVQDGLIKMYVSEENSGLANDISVDEWNNLKKIMQGIITGGVSNITYLPYSSQAVFNEPKAIALNDANIISIKNAYKNAVPTTVTNEPLLNKDILSQSFGDNVSSQEPIQISEIPKVQNTFNMESTPVNLNMISSLDTNNSVQMVGPQVSGVEPELAMPAASDQVTTSPVIPTIEPIPTNDIPKPEVVGGNDEVVLNINSIKPGGIDSGFKVSDQPNIFDNPVMPYQISEEEINSTNETVDNNVFILETSNTLDNNLNVNNIGFDNVNQKKIELNNRKIKLFEELANIYKEENELLSNGNVSTSDKLENTASNLFNNNGTLNDSIV